MSETVYDKQRREAHQEILASGGFLMRTPIDLQQALYEDQNAYHIEITDTLPGPSVHLFVGLWRCDYFPCNSYERALEMARRL